MSFELKPFSMNKEVIIIVRYLSKNRGIGYQQKDPWQNIEAATNHFNAHTTGHTVIMDEDTLASLDGRILSKRQNIIVSTTLNQEDLPQEALLAKTLKEAITMATGKKIFLIGGEGIYKEALESGIANTILATIIYDEPECDSFFPKISNSWIVVHEGAKGIDPQSEILIQFVTFKNKSNPFLLVSE